MRVRLIVLGERAGQRRGMPRAACDLSSGRASRYARDIRKLMEHCAQRLTGDDRRVGLTRSLAVRKGTLIPRTGQVRELAPWLLLAASIVGLGGCGKEQAAAPAMPAVPVVAAQAERKTVPVEIRAIGNVEAYSNVSIKAQVTGLVIAVQFHEGQDVHRCDILFEIDKRPFEVALQQAEADYARDTAKAQNAR